MARHSGTATDYIDAAQKLALYCVNNAATLVVVAGGGTGYVVGEILTVSGGTATTLGATTLEVTAETAGVIDSGGVKIINSGSYTTNPTNAVSTTGSTNDDATFTMTYTNLGWTQERRTQEAASATVAAGGTSGYIVGDLLTVVGGTDVRTTAIFRVATINGSGVVLTVDQGTGAVVGNYGEVPANNVAVTGGSGTGAVTLTVTWADALTQDSDFILNGNGAGADDIFVGIRTYNDTSVFNWELAGFTGFDAGLTWENQASISIGRNDNQVAGIIGGSFVPVANTSAQSVTYWFQVDSYSITMVMRNGTSYTSGHMGWLNPFGTASEFPYPLFVGGSTADPAQSISDTDVSFSGFSDPIVYVANINGPCQYRTPAGAWVNVSNSNVQSSIRQVNNDWTIFPAGKGLTDTPNPVAEEDLTFEDTFNFDDIIPATGIPGSSTFDMDQTPATGDDVTFFWPLTLVQQDGASQVHGEIRNCYWASTQGGVVSEDTFRPGGVDYRIFQNGNRTNTWAHWVMREN